MQTRKRLIAFAAAALIVLGTLCPTICLAGGGDVSSPRHVDAAADLPPPCHGPPTGETPDAGGSSRPEHTDCLHCASPALQSTADGLFDVPPLALPTTGQLRAVVLASPVDVPRAHAHDPPPPDRLLVTNAFLL